MRILYRNLLIAIMSHFQAAETNIFFFNLPKICTGYWLRDMVIITIVAMALQSLVSVVSAVSVAFGESNCSDLFKSFNESLSLHFILLVSSNQMTPCWKIITFQVCLVFKITYASDECERPATNLYHHSPMNNGPNWMRVSWSAVSRTNFTWAYKRSKLSGHNRNSRHGLTTGTRPRCAACDGARS